MYSLFVHYFGDQFSTIKTGVLGYFEELPMGVDVEQKYLARMICMAAICYLKQNGYIQITMKEGGFLMFKGMQPYVTLVKEDDGSLQGVEGSFFNQLKGGKEKSVSDLVRGLVSFNSDNPWGVVANMAKNELIAGGFYNKVPGKKLLFIIPTSRLEIDESRKSYAQNELQKLKTDLEKFKEDSQTYAEIDKAIDKGLKSREQHNTGIDD